MKHGDWKRGGQRFMPPPKLPRAGAAPPWMRSNFPQPQPKAQRPNERRERPKDAA
jgi:hypothetical protein